MYILINIYDNPVDVFIIYTNKETIIKKLWYLIIEYLLINNNLLDNLELLLDSDIIRYYILVYIRINNNGNYYLDKKIIINNFAELLRNQINIELSLLSWIKLLDDDIIPEDLLNCTIEIPYNLV